jgi:hypothetical protein
LFIHLKEPASVENRVGVVPMSLRTNSIKEDLGKLLRKDFERISVV